MNEPNLVALKVKPYRRDPPWFDLYCRTQPTDDLERLLAHLRAQVPRGPQ